MKKTIYIICSIALFALTVTIAKGQDSCRYTNRLNLSTGIDNLGNLLPVGTRDPNWRLINVASPSVNGSGSPLIQIPDAYVVFNNYATPPSSTMAWNYVAGAAPISALNSANFGINNTVADQPWRFSRQFCVRQRTEVTVQGNFRADDGGRLVLKDASGNALYTFSNPPNVTNAFTLDHTYTTSLILNSGKYFLEVELENRSSGMMGFALNCVISAGGGSSLIQPGNRCCPLSNIVSLQKMIDNNCSGQNDAGDLPGAGWVFTLQSTTGYTKTGTTGASGELFFYDVPAGSYTLSETLQAGFNAVFPSGGAASFTLNNQGAVKNFVFLNTNNCPPAASRCCQNTLGLTSAAAVPPSYPFNGGTYAVERYNITVPSNVPISEIKVAVTSFEWLNDAPEDCKQCQIRTNNLGSIFGSVNVGGTTIASTVQPYGNGISSTANNNEVVFSFPNGRTFNVGDFLKLTYILPPEKNLTCCRTRVKVCRKISWKDINCGYCEIYDCSTVDLKNSGELRAGFPLPDPLMLYLNTRDLFVTGHADGF